MSEPVWWTYGVVSGPTSVPAGVTGVDGARVEIIREGGLAALASPVPPDCFSREALQERLNDFETLGELARAHEAVLDAVLADHDVVPFRMCTIYGTADAIRRVLAAESERFDEALARLHGMTEWGVKGFVMPAEDERPAQQPSSGREYLARRLAQRASEASSNDSLEQAAAELHGRLAQRASAAVLTRPQDRRLSGRDEEMVLNGSYLVARDAAGEFARLVEALDGRHRLALEITGPWPAYHFTEGPA